VVFVVAEDKNQVALVDNSFVDNKDLVVQVDDLADFAVVDKCNSFHSNYLASLAWLDTDTQDMVVIVGAYAVAQMLWLYHQLNQ
jgi:hypothetical protein